jgi:hypothetical protein
MGPQPKPQAAQAVAIDPLDPRWADVCEGLAEIERGEGIALTDEEADHYFETGDLPERVETCELSSSRRGT